jgi:hypothetical protein
VAGGRFRESNSRHIICIAMVYAPFGVKCKTAGCNTGIILEDVWFSDHPLRQGDRIEFVVLRPTTLRCPKCQLEHEYVQADARTFPEVPPLVSHGEHPWWDRAYHVAVVL